MAKKASTAKAPPKATLKVKVVTLKTGTAEGSSGDVVTLDIDYADRLIAKGLAEEVQA